MNTNSTQTRGLRPTTARSSFAAGFAKSTALAVVATSLTLAGVGIAQALPSQTPTGGQAARHETSKPTASEQLRTQPRQAPYVVADRRTADLDGDGAREVITLLMPRTTGRHQLLRVRWSDGTVSTRTLPNTVERELRRPVDIDADGDLDLIVHGGGGEYSELLAFRVGDHRIGGKLTMSTPVTGDVDGDGRGDQVSYLTPAGLGGEQRVLVQWGGGGSASAPVANDMERSVRVTQDLDGDGAEEIVVSGGGGEYGELRFFTAVDRRLVPVTVVDQDGSHEVLVDTADAEWQAQVTGDGVVSIRFHDPAGQTLPKTVDVRTWAFAGTTLTQSSASTLGCADLVDYQWQITPGACS